MHAVRMARGQLAGLFLLGVVVILAPAKTGALELGMTPSHVYGLWLNINKVFLQLRDVRFAGQTLASELEIMTPNAFRDKKPGDVFARADRVWRRLAETFGLGPLPPPPAWIEDYLALEGTSEHTEVTPSQVFVLSSKILNALVDSYVKETSGNREISSFYIDNKAAGKAPSDVFGLVDLLDRRLARLRTGRKPADGNRP